MERKVVASKVIRLAAAATTAVRYHGTPGNASWWPISRFDSVTQLKTRRSVMSKKPVRYEMDPKKPPALTKAQKAELEALKAASDSTIDYSDIPELSESFWKNAVRRVQ
jgi:hypothetical protein